MDYDKIKKLMDDMGNSKLDSLDIEFPDGIKISMTKNSNTVYVNPQTVIHNEQNQIEEDNKTVEENGEEENSKVIKAPMVGTFYESSSPGVEPFVQVGDKVKKGQVVCIVEAMKLMNEIESEYDGEIVEVCVKNEDMVEFGTPLFKIK